MGEILKNPELLVILITIATGIFKAFKFVQEGELGIKLRFGKAMRNRDQVPRVIHPGFVFLLPFIDTLKRHHVRQETIRFDHQQIMIKGGLIFVVNAIVIFRIKDIYKALFEIEHLEFSIEDLGMGILRDELSALEYTELNNTESISDALLEKIKHFADQWGVEFIQFKLTSCAPTTNTASLINAKVGVVMKLEALKEAFKGDTSELTEGLAAVLIGVPLVASVQVDVNNPKLRPQQSSANPSLMEKIFGPPPAKSEQGSENA